MQRVRIGLTGLAFVFLAVMLAMVFTREPADLSPERHAHSTLLMRGESYLPGCLVVGAALRWQMRTGAALVCLVDDSVSA